MSDEFDINDFLDNDEKSDDSKDIDKKTKRNLFKEGFDATKDIHKKIKGHQIYREHRHKIRKTLLALSILGIGTLGYICGGNKVIKNTMNSFNTYKNYNEYRIVPDIKTQPDSKNLEDLLTDEKQFTDEYQTGSHNLGLSKNLVREYVKTAKKMIYVLDNSTLQGLVNDLNGCIDDYINVAKKSFKKEYNAYSYDLLIKEKGTKKTVQEIIELKDNIDKILKFESEYEELKKKNGFLENYYAYKNKVLRFGYSFPDSTIQKIKKELKKDKQTSDKINDTSIKPFKDFLKIVDNYIQKVEYVKKTEKLIEDKKYDEAYNKIIMLSPLNDGYDYNVLARLNNCLDTLKAKNYDDTKISKGYDHINDLYEETTRVSDILNVVTQRKPGIIFSELALLLVGAGIGGYKRIRKYKKNNIKEETEDNDLLQSPKETQTPDPKILREQLRKEMYENQNEEPQ